MRPRDLGRRLLGWVSPGFGFKRHVAVLVLGALVGALGLSELLRRAHAHLIEALSGGVAAMSDAEVALLLAAAVALTAYAIGRITRSVVDAAISPGVGRLFRGYPEAALASRGPRIVAIGGGTGLSVLLRGLKRYTWNLTAVVAVSDDGGSSGRLRAELGMPPPGDIRNCLVALADTEPLMERLFQHRMAAGEGLKDHAFGNLFLAAMTQITDGDFERAIRESSRVLAVRGRVLPSTLVTVVLSAELEDGRRVEGETRIVGAGSPIRRIDLVPERPAPLAEVLEAIAEADLVVFGPGSLYTSIVPNLLVAGMSEALRGTGAIRVYVSNIMTQPGETDGMDAAEHVAALIAHGATIDVAVVNTGRPGPQTLDRYRREGAVPVPAAVDALRGRGVRVVQAALQAGEEGPVRHEADTLARTLVSLVLERRVGMAGRRERVAAGPDRADGPSLG